MKTKATVRADAILTLRGCSDDTVDVSWTAEPNAGLEDDDCAAGMQRWLRVELPTGGGVLIGARYAVAGGWFVGVAPLDEDSTSPAISLQQHGYSMVLTMPVPNGTRLTIWQGAEDRA